ncbi:MAG: anhydro-N-acetylmuramic acid kinase [Gammaproteobacteria bacterium]|jgi:anhydro-N-acetylmuramic acid kinase
MTNNIYIGAMSGTSLDGIDAVLVSFDGDKPHIIDHLSMALPENIRGEAFDLIADDKDGINRLYRLANNISLTYAQCINRLLSNNKGCKVIAAGCHGQTIRHFPNDPLAFTIQCINGAGLALAIKTPTVVDFRSADIWAGGQGAPLAPGFHAKLFRKASSSRVILNLGGIANITYLPSNETEPVIGFDTGTASSLMDYWINANSGSQFDSDGTWASSGTVNKTLLELLCNDDYFRLLPPKSTGREYFSPHWLQEKLRGFKDIKSQNVQATLLEFSATTIVKAINLYCPETQEIYACGGGTKNSALMSRISTLLESKTFCSTESLGLDPQLVEACAFAWLAMRRVNQQTGNLPDVTGAKREVVLGALYQP